MRYLLVLALLSGCSALAPRSTAAMVSAASLYCAKTPEDRAIIRTQINSELAAQGITVRLTCPGDE